MTSTAGKIAGWDINSNRLSAEYTDMFSFNADGSNKEKVKVSTGIYSHASNVIVNTPNLSSSGIDTSAFRKKSFIRIFEYGIRKSADSDADMLLGKRSTTFGIGSEGETIIHNGNAGNYISIGDTVDVYGDMNIYGKLKTRYSIAPVTESSGKFACGLEDARWSTVYSNDVNADGKIYFPGITSSTSVTRTLYVGATAGQLYYKASSSSKTIKHDVLPLQNEEITAERLYDLEVVQFKYNEDVLSSGDQRYMTDMPGFIIEQMNEVYPIAVDKETDNVKDWAWNAQYLIPPMLKLIQGQHKNINGLFASKNDMSARMDSLSCMLEQAFSEIENLKKENETLKQALA